MSGSRGDIESPTAHIDTGQAGRVDANRQRMPTLGTWVCAAGIWTGPIHGQLCWMSATASPQAHRKDGPGGSWASLRQSVLFFGHV